MTEHPTTSHIAETINFTLTINFQNNFDKIHSDIQKLKLE